MIAGLVLAAGLSSRMAPHNKLLIRNHSGQPMITRTVASLRASTLDHVLVVTGHQASQVEQAARQAGQAHFVDAADYADGLSASLKSGIAALPTTTQAVLVCLGDMPLVTPELIDRLIDAYRSQPRPNIVVPTCHGQRGNPVLWDRAYFAEMLALRGDTGARALVQRHARNVVHVETGDQAVLLDFDTPEQLGV